MREGIIFKAIQSEITKYNCGRHKEYAGNIIRTQKAEISSITFQFPVFKQYVNSTQQNGFSNHSACMYVCMYGNTAWR